MKTAISINTEIYKAAEQTARQLGLSRSKLYSLALEEFIQTHKPEAITEKLNEVYGANDSTVDDDIVQATHDLLSRDAW